MGICIRNAKKILNKLQSEGKIKISNYQFPPKQELKLKLKDILEETVDEKYYLKEEQIARIKNSNFMQEKTRIQDKEFCDTLLARDWKDPKCVRIGGIFDTETSKHQAGSVYDENGLCPTIDTMQGGWRQPIVITHEIKQTVRKAKIDNNINNQQTNMPIPSITVGENQKEIKKTPSIIQKCGDRGTNNYSVSDLSYTIPANPMSDRGQLLIDEIEDKPRIRKLTPREVWRLMGFKDEEFEKAAKLNSNTQLYKQARKFYCG